jgi:hypothetical protein
MVLPLTANGGKADAVRQGVLHAVRTGSSALIGYWDADLSTPLEELQGMLAVFERQPAARLVMGSRVRRLGSNIRRRAVRRLLGRIFSALASQILDLPIYDSQCGAKLFRREIAETVFAERFIPVALRRRDPRASPRAFGRKRFADHGRSAVERVA